VGGANWFVIATELVKREAGTMDIAGSAKASKLMRNFLLSFLVFCFV
jgi:hypothetical protein